jgi:hypothetical protein
VVRVVLKLPLGGYGGAAAKRAGGLGRGVIPAGAAPLRVVLVGLLERVKVRVWRVLLLVLLRRPVVGLQLLLGVVQRLWVGMVGRGLGRGRWLRLVGAAALLLGHVAQRRADLRGWFRVVDSDVFGGDIVYHPGADALV